MLEWTVDQYEQYCRENHNACFLLLLIGPTMLCCLAKILPRGKPSRLTMAQLQVSFLDSTSTKSFYVELLSLLRGPATSVQVFAVNFWLNLHFWYWPVLRTKQAFPSWLLAYWFFCLEETLNHAYTLLGQASCTHSILGETCIDGVVIRQQCRNRE